MGEHLGEVAQTLVSVAAAAEENSASVEEVTATTEEMSAQVEAVSASAAELSSLAEQLDQAVSSFRLDEQGGIRSELAPSAPARPQARAVNPRGGQPRQVASQTLPVKAAVTHNGYKPVHSPN